MRRSRHAARSSPRGGDLAYIATDDPAVGARVRIVAPTGVVAERIVTEHAEHTPRWSPSGRHLAFVAAGPQGDGIHVVAPDGSTRSTVTVGEGWRVDDLQWIDEGCLALIAAPLITDTAVGRGAQRGSTGAGPLVCTNDRLRRRLVTVDLSTGRPEPVDIGPATVWEMCPLDRERFVAIVSDDPTESGWYAARLSMLDRIGGEQPLYRPAWQIAAPRGSPDGSRVALVEGWSSDRGFVAGGVVVIDLLERSATAWSIDGLDVTGLEWLDDRTLHVHGWRGTQVGPRHRRPGRRSRRDRRRRGCAARDGDRTPRGAGDHHGGDGARRLSRPHRRRVRRGRLADRRRAAARRGPRAERRRAPVDRGGRHRAARAAAHPGRRRSGHRRAGAAPPRRTGEPVDAGRVSRRRRTRLVRLRRDPAQPARQRRTWAGVRPGQPRRSRRPRARRRPRRGGDVSSRGPRRRPRAGGGGRLLRRLPDRGGGRATPRSRCRRGDVRPPRPRQRSLRRQQPGVLRHPPRWTTDRRNVRPLPRSVARVPRPRRRATDADPARRRRPLHPGRTGRRAVPRPARARRAGRARRVPRRGPRPAVPAAQLDAWERTIAWFDRHVRHGKRTTDARTRHGALHRSPAAHGRTDRLRHHPGGVPAGLADPRRRRRRAPQRPPDQRPEHRQPQGQVRPRPTAGLPVLGLAEGRVPRQPRPLVPHQRAGQRLDQGPLRPHRDAQLVRPDPRRRHRRARSARGRPCGAAARATAPSSA